MDRRGFLRFLGLGAAAAVAPTKAYSFLGGILRPRKELVLTPKAGIPFKFEPVITYYAMLGGGWTTEAAKAGVFEFGDPLNHIPGNICYMGPPAETVEIRGPSIT